MHLDPDRPGRSVKVTTRHVAPGPLRNQDRNETAGEDNEEIVKQERAVEAGTEDALKNKTVETGKRNTTEGGH